MWYFKNTGIRGKTSQIDSHVTWFLFFSNFLLWFICSFHLIYLTAYLGSFFTDLYHFSFLSAYLCLLVSILLFFFVLVSPKPYIASRTSLPKNVQACTRWLIFWWNLLLTENFKAVNEATPLSQYLRTINMQPLLFFCPFSHVFDFLLSPCINLCHHMLFCGNW